MATIQIVYATKSGVTRDIATSLSERLRALGHETTLNAVDEKPPVTGDVVVFTSGVRVGKWHSPATAWAKARAAELASRPVAAVTVCLDVLDNPDKARGYGAAALNPAQLAPAVNEALPGRVILKELGRVERTIMRAVMKQRGMAEGDYRDLDAEQELAERIAALV